MKITFWPALFLIFLTLKLTGSIAWSWVWITAPLWGGFLLFFILLFLVLWERDDRPR
jgi:hypothetical protein